MAATSPTPERRPGAAARRRDQEREILAATRTLFDERGVRDAQIEDVAREAGLNKALIYRHFSGKEELFALAIVDYTEELTAEMDRLPTTGSATERLTAMTDAFLDFCLRYPAFIDCAMAMLRQPGAELLEQISEAAMLRMGRAVAGAMQGAVALLREGNAGDEFAIDDPDYTVNAIYVQILGLAHLARVGNGIRELPGGLPWFFPIDDERLRQTVRTLVLATLRPTALA
jgi:AcrR family transcriptional regulator